MAGLPDDPSGGARQLPDSGAVQSLEPVAAAHRGRNRYMMIPSRLLLAATLLLASGSHAAEQAVWIDVRTSVEYATGHLSEAVNIPFDRIAQRIGELVADPDAEIRLYCATGGRSGYAKRVLESMGYRNVHNDGGYAGLRARVGN